MSNKENLNSAIKALAKNLNVPEQEVKAAIESGQINRLLGKMDKSKANQLNSIINDSEASKKIIESPQAQAIMKKLFGE